MDILKDLEFRGLIHQVTDKEGLEEKLKEGSVALYAGFDPTADSLHIGSLQPIMTLMRFQLAGHKPIPLVGGATGLIGDPSGKANERTLNTAKTVQEWSDKIQKQLSRFLDFETAVLENNFDWTKELDVISFLRDVGKNFSLNYMLAKESVDSRIEKGISFTEFSYMLLQANDFLQLFKKHGCVLQIGGSDQWGNITAGLELVRKTEGEQVFGLTSPLVTKVDGTKFGKTESGTIWLDPEKTSPYEFYQFWLNTADQDVVKFLKYFTFLTHEEIEALEKEVQTNPGARVAQKKLAEEVTKIVHGEESLKKAQNITFALFKGDIRSLSKEELQEGMKDVPATSFKKGEGFPVFVDFLVQIGVASSKRQAREDLKNGAISLNGEKMNEEKVAIEQDDLLHGEFVVVRRGKKNYFLAKFE